jgi:transposase
LEAALGERIGVSQDEWALIGPLLPPERGRGCRPAGDNRSYFEGMMWVARTGAQWRHLSDEYGKWNSVFRRYRRWVLTGVFDAMLETLSELAGRDPAADMIDSTVVRAHHGPCALLGHRITVADQRQAQVDHHGLHRRSSLAMTARLHPKHRFAPAPTARVIALLPLEQARMGISQ